MRKRILCICAAAVFCAAPAPIFADELEAIFKKVHEHVEAKNYPKAMEELTWAQKEIEKRNSQHLKSFLPDQLLEYKGEKVEANSAMGFTNIEREYVKAGSSDRVKVSITGAGGTGVAGGLAAFGRMAALMGNQPGMETIRIQGKTATLEHEEGSTSASLSIFLDSGSIVKFESYEISDAGELKKLAEALQLDALDQYLRGAKS